MFSNSASLEAHPLPRLPRNLSTVETWGFGLTAHATWPVLVATIHAGIGAQSIYVLVPAILVGMLLNYQIKRLGRHFGDVSGGTPNYGTRLLKRYPAIARYTALSYCFGWIVQIPLNALVLADLIQTSLHAVGLDYPGIILKIGLTLLPFALAFSGTRALAILHLVFVVPAIGFLLVFCVQGIGWLAFSPNSPGLFIDVPLPSLGDWMKWFFFFTFLTYACEITSSFIADSRRPTETLKVLDVSAWLSPVIFLGGTWVVVRLVPLATEQDGNFSILVKAAQPFWGGMATWIVEFWLVATCLLGFATAVSNCPRILYQMSRDRQLAPVFGVVSQRGVFGPALLLVLAGSLTCLAWGNPIDIVATANVCYVFSIVAIHWGIWLQHRKPEALLPRLSLAIFLLEVPILLIGAAAWGWQTLIGGMLIPIGLIAVDALIRRARLVWLSPHWWLQHYQKPAFNPKADLLMVQVVTLIGLLCSVLLIGWWFGNHVSQYPASSNDGVIIVLVSVVVFVGVAIACWTSLPQFYALDEARETAEQAQTQLQDKTLELQATLKDLKQAQVQIVQSEKMSSLGQLVAGVAHEINNPVNFIHGNLSHLNEYTHDLLRMISLYQERHPSDDPEVQTLAEEIDLEFLTDDIQKIVGSMTLGTERIHEIVKSLKNFSRMDEAEFKAVDIHEGIESTLMILQYRLKDRPDRPAVVVTKNYGKLPQVECYPGQLNQVVMNILVNALDALDEMNTKRTYKDIQANPDQIMIHTSVVGSQWVEIAIADNGPGLPESTQQRIFEPFFTTKPIGKGTGMGMSISHQIITEKHGGTLSCVSTPGAGAKFVIQIPVQQRLQAVA